MLEYTFKSYEYLSRALRSNTGTAHQQERQSRRVVLEMAHQCEKCTVCRSIYGGEDF